MLAARGAGQREAKRSAQQSVQRRVILRIARVAWHGIVQLIAAREGGGRRTRCAAGVQLYFPREDDDGMLLFVSRASLSLSIAMVSHCHAKTNGAQTRSSFFLHTLLSLCIMYNIMISHSNQMHI